MPLVAARDSVLVVVDAQAGFVSAGVMDERARAIASATVERIVRRVAAGTPTIAKTTFALTASSDALDRIAEVGRRTAVLTGFETDTCVAQSGVGLRDRGYRVVVPRDATWSSGDAEHEHGLERLRGAGAEIASCKGVTFEWLEHVATALDVLPRARCDFDVLPWRL